MKRYWIVFTVLMVLVLVLSACAPAEPDVVEVTRVVTETETVTEQIEVTRIVEGEVQTEQVEVTRVVEVAQEPLIVRVAFPSSIDVDDVAALLAFERMQEQGFVVVPTFYAQGELAAAAVASGQADFGVGASTVWIGAIQQGAPLKGVVEQAKNGWSVMAVNDVETCEDVDGMRTAIHSEGSVSTAMLRAWIQDTCPDIEPNYLVIPGSENRAAALMAGEIDVTPSELIDSIQINALRPGEFHRIANFGADLPNLKTGGFWVREEFAQENPDAVENFIRNILEVHRQISDEPDWFEEQVPRFLEMDEEQLALLPEIVDTLISVDNYPVNGGLTEESGQGTLDFFIDSGRLEPGLTAGDVYDLSYLNNVLDEIGRR